ncbi:MAG: hypothetical protein ACRERV_06950 [Methylococcales bacterium]
MVTRLSFVLIVALSGLGASPCARADSVIDWNNIVLDAVRRTHENPPRATRALAMVHIAVFDAVNGIEVHREPCGPLLQFFISRAAELCFNPIRQFTTSLSD